MVPEPPHDEKRPFRPFVSLEVAGQFGSMARTNPSKRDVHDRERRYLPAHVYAQSSVPGAELRTLAPSAYAPGPASRAHTA
jgi:hypothetical protein